MEGAAPGTMMAPPLAGSPRVPGASRLRDQGAASAGSPGRSTARPTATSWCRWAATRRVGGGDRVVRPQQLRQQRRHGDARRRRARARRDGHSQERRGPFPELEASLPRLLDAQQWKLTASHGAETAAGAATLRGWSSGVPQAPDMWIAVELAQPVVVTEVQFDSNMASGGRGGRGGRGAPGAAPAPPHSTRHRIPSRLLGAGVGRTARRGASPLRPARARACTRRSRSRRRARSSSASRRRTPSPTRPRGRSGTCASTRRRRPRLGRAEAGSGYLGTGLSSESQL